MANTAPMSAYPVFRRRVAHTTSEFINWALDASSAAIQNMGVDHRSTDVGVTEQLLDYADIRAIFKAVSSLRLEKYWIPGQARNDELSETYIVIYSR